MVAAASGRDGSRCGRPAASPTCAPWSGPKKPTSNVCWCLSHRLDSTTNRVARRGRSAASTSRSWSGAAVAPGVLAYDGDEVVGWAAVAPRSELPFARRRKIPHVDDLPVWSLWCLRVRPGHRGQGIAAR